MAGYEDTRQKIISTLMGRPVGTEIQPENQQEYELNMLDYIRGLELIATSTLIGIAEQNTTPVQPNNSRVCYIAGVAQNQTAVFKNFIDVNGNPISITTGDMEGVLVILMWNTQYWSAQTISTNIISQAQQAIFYYNYNIRKTYSSVVAMNDDVANPIGTDGKYIKVGDLVSVVNSTTPSENGFYSYEGAENGWKLQSSFNFQLVQTTGTDINSAMSQNAVTILYNSLKTVVDSIKGEIPFINDSNFNFYSDYNKASVSADANSYWLIEKIDSLNSFIINSFKAFITLTNESTPASVEVYSLSSSNLVLAKIASWSVNASGDSTFTPSSPITVDYAQKFLVRVINGSFKYSRTGIRTGLNFYNLSNLTGVSNPVGITLIQGNKFTSDCVSINLIGTAYYYTLKSSITSLNNQNALPIYNVTKQVPLTSGNYYTAVTSRTAVPVANRKGGLILIYQDQTDGWLAQQFTNSDDKSLYNSYWTNAVYWQFIATGKTLTDLQNKINTIYSLFSQTNNIYSTGLNVNNQMIDNVGNIATVTNCILSYQTVLSNTEYLIRNGQRIYSVLSTGRLAFFDSLGNKLSTVDMGTLSDYLNGKLFTTPANCVKICFNVYIPTTNFDARNNIELYKGKETATSIYVSPLTLQDIILLNSNLESFKNSQNLINIDLYDKNSISTLKVFGEANWGRILVSTSSSDNPMYYWNSWQPLTTECVLQKINLNPLRIASVTSWRSNIKFGIVIAKDVQGSSTGQIEVVSITTFDYVQGNTEIDISSLNIRVPVGYYVLFSSVNLGTNSALGVVPSYGYQTGSAGSTQYFSNGAVGSKSVAFTGAILSYDYSISYLDQESLKTKVLEDDQRITALENQEPDIISNEVNIDTVTDVMFMGSSLTSSHYQPKSTSWIERLNDMVDIVVVNNGVSGYNLGTNMGQLVNNTALDKDSGNTPKNLKPKYIWWNNSANGTPAGLTGITQLMNAMEITASYGAKMLLGSEEDYSNIAKSLEDTYRAFSAEHGVPYSPMIQVWRKCYPSSNPYKGWIAANHSGYRAMAPYNMHKALLQAIQIDKSVKMFKVRPTYKSGSPVIGDLSYDTIEQRLKFFTAISAGAADSTATNAIDTLDDHTYDVPGGSNTGISISETSMMKRSAAITFNKFALIEFILDNVNITKGNFEIVSSVQPTKVYIAMTKNSSTTYNDAPRTQFVETAFTYSGGKISCSVVRTDYDIQLFDKVRFIIEYSGSFTLTNPRFYQYDGRAKAKKPDVLNGYSYRKYGTELNPNTAFPMTGHGWTLANTAAVKALPTEIANYTSYNAEKSHLQLNTDTDTATKSIAITQPISKVAVRIIACIWPKLATTKFVGTAIENSEYIDATAPQVTTYDYDYGTIQLRINTNIVRKQVVLQGWHELYFEVDIDPTDTSLNIEIGRSCFVDSSYSNANKPMFVHDISVQAIK